MAVALRDLERGHVHRRPALRVVPAQPSPPRTPPPVFWLRRALVVALVVLVMLGVVGVVRAAIPDAPADHIDMTVVIPAGGTLWDLAERYAPTGADRSTWVAAVAEHNDVDPAAIRPGTAVAVPVRAQHVTATPQPPSGR
jgi:nucleoid-associated protein YgaU